jgi:5,6-dimethylbenzimidazole synthase
LTGDRILSEASPLFDAEFAERFTQLLRWRRDVRHFDRRAVAEEDMRAMLTSASLAPSVDIAQPWRFVRLRSPGIRDAVAAHVDEQDVHAAERYFGQERYEHYLSLKLHGLRDAPEPTAGFCDEQPGAGHGVGIATMPKCCAIPGAGDPQSVVSGAAARHWPWLGVILDPPTVKAMLAVPGTWSLIALLCIGYPADTSDTPELARLGWQPREPWSDRVFER